MRQARLTALHLTASLFLVFGCSSDSETPDPTPTTPPPDPNPPAIELPTSCGAPEEATDPGGECTGDEPTDLTLTRVAQGLAEPLDLAAPTNDTARLFVAERTGRVRIIKNGRLVSAPFLDLSDTVETGYPEQGLLGIVFEPGEAQPARLWLNYTQLRDQVPYTVVASVDASTDDPDVADRSTLTPLFEVRQPARNHNGGQLAFGPDGCLFVSFGDGGDGNDPWGNGQALADREIDGDPMSGLLGGMARVDVQSYPTPAPGNLDVTDANPHIWSYGLRNPWRYSFDRDTGDMYIGDVGQGAWEEVDVEPAGSVGFNYGWNQMEGLHCRGIADDSGDCERDSRPPAAEYRNPPEDDTPRAVIGGYVYRGVDVPQLTGRYLYADYMTRQISSFVYAGEGDAGPEICDEVDLTDQLSVGSDINAFGQDARGELYIMTAGGDVLRIDTE